MKHVPQLLAWSGYPQIGASKQLCPRKNSLYNLQCRVSSLNLAHFGKTSTAIVDIGHVRLQLSK
jgi:hypothetical protein